MAGEKRTSANHFRLAYLLAGVALAATFVVVGPAGVASAGPPPVLRPPTAQPSVSADPLPTVQIDGVVWAQVATGSIAWAGGSFTKARPAGAAPGVNTVTRNNLVSYNVADGTMRTTSTTPTVNGQVKALALSPDGTTVYVGGEFTSANGQTRNRIAAYNTATGALLSTFKPSVNYHVLAIVATADTVYIGGKFTSIGGQTRNRLAALRASDGALLGWNPSADSDVMAMVISPDKSKVVAGGRFATVGGKAAYGLAAIGTADAALKTWNVGSVVKNAGPNSAIWSMTSKGNVVYGTGYKFGSGGNFEGTFAASFTNGDVVWIEDCHGDSYGAAQVGDTVYVVSHAHACNNVGGFPEVTPRVNYHAHAFTAAAPQNVTTNYFSSYSNFNGQPAPTPVGWFPEPKTGTYTGLTQAAWTLAGTDNYLLMGGEFPSVNGVAQQGLARFAIRSMAPNKVKPTPSASGMVLKAVSLTTGQVRVGLQASSDVDDPSLTYTLLRGGTTPVASTTVNSTFYLRPYISLTDTAAGSGTQSYKVQVKDPWGNTVTSNSVSATVTGTVAVSAYSDLVRKTYGASTYWRLGESSGSAAYDWAGGGDGTEGSGVTRGVAGAVVGSTAVSLNGSSSGIVQHPALSYGPQVFTVQAWIKTSTTASGQILSFTGNNFADRSLYMTTNGRLYFVTYDGAYETVSSPGAYNDSQWHLVTGTLDSSGMKIYVDGTLRGSRSDVTSAFYQYGSWRVGGERVTGYPGGISKVNFTGSVDEVAIYPTALTATQISNLYAARTSPGGAAPQAAAVEVAPAEPQPGPNNVPAPAVQKDGASVEDSSAAPSAPAGPTSTAAPSSPAAGTSSTAEPTAGVTPPGTTTTATVTVVPAG